MASRIAVPRVKRGDESRSERQARALKTRIRFLQARYSLTLLLIEMNQALQGDCWDQDAPTIATEKNLAVDQ